MLDEWHKCIDLHHKGKPIVEEPYARRGLLKDLDLELVRPHMNERLTITNLPQNLKMIMKLCKIEHTPSEDIPAGSKRCS
jgi:hypothetical protein